MVQQTESSSSSETIHRILPPSPPATDNMNLLALKENTLSLAKIRDVLIRCEDTIIFAFIERAQFMSNAAIYEPGKFAFANGFSGSFLSWFLLEVESVHAKVRRYTSPDEYPFSSPSSLPAPILQALPYPSILHPNDININPQIFDIYVKEIIPVIAAAGDDLNYGSATTRDIEALQAISRRIHYGKFVAEAKFIGPEHDKYVSLIKAQDRAAIEELLTDRVVEARLLARLEKKAMAYGQDPDDVSAVKNYKVRPQVIRDVYEKFVIPLTKLVEVDYLLRRLD
ncbi:chorismate mutase [Synchytrium microbalum]|uniref:Chorismate mutase n=1 Tax=Synchytrium microbalum TaxID=1806994 RepID=A0A507C8I4_9FUNG|nr:chorismate mutase [Synchytrium microbalum]TPX33843.1 chorismate mutase [Synchytrium microbalum]